MTEYFDRPAIARGEVTNTVRDTLTEAAEVLFNADGDKGELVDDIRESLPRGWGYAWCTQRARKLSVQEPRQSH